MVNRLKALFRGPFSRISLPAKPGAGILLSRLVVVLLIVFPFILIISAEFFESLERSGPAGAVIANTSLSIMIVSYLVALAYMLKQGRA